MTQGDRRAPVLMELSPDELTWLNNALNEVCNGIAIADFEFQTRLGATRSEMETLLARIRRAAS